MTTQSLVAQNDYWNGPFNTVDDIDRDGRVAIGVAGGVPQRILHIDGNFLFDSPTNFAIETGFGNLFMHNGSDIFNTFTGYNAAANATGTRLTHSGHRAGFGDRGQWNTFNGYESGLGNFFGSYNAFFGAWSGLNNSNGELNTFIGAEAGRDNENGYSNTYVGFRAGLSSGDSYNNTAVGSSALQNNNVGFGNVALGEGAFFSVTDRNLNIGIGNSAGRNLTDMTSMIIIGSNANDNVGLAENSVVAGNNSFRVGNTLTGSVLLGDRVAENLQSSLNSVIIGEEATAAGVAIDECVILGNRAAMSAIGSGASVVIGDRCLENLQNLENSVTIGADIGFGSTSISTSESVVIGAWAMSNWTTAVSNIVIGTRGAPDLDTGRDNVIIGTDGGLNFTDDEQNVLLGNNTEKIGTDVVLNSTLIGHEAKVDAGTGGGGAVREEASAIGYQSEVCDDYTMVLGKHSTANPTTVVIGSCSTHFGGAERFEVHGSAAKNVGGGMWNTWSDKRLKKEITPFQLGLKELTQIETVTFKYDFTALGEAKVIENHNKEVGVIAQDFMKVNDDLTMLTINQNSDDDFYSFNPNALLYLLINSVKEQQIQIDSLANIVNDLTNSTERNNFDDIENYNSENYESTSIKGELKQNRPNPFSEETIIKYKIEGDYQNGNISILDFEGRQIRDFGITEQHGEIRFNGSAFPSGIYFYGLFVDNEMLDIRKMIIAR